MAAFAHKITLFFFSATCIRIFQHCRPARHARLSLLLRAVLANLHATSAFPNAASAFLLGDLSVYPIGVQLDPIRGTTVPYIGYTESSRFQCTLAGVQLDPCRETLTNRRVETPRAGVAIRNPGAETHVGQGRGTPRRSAGTARREKILTSGYCPHGQNT